MSGIEGYFTDFFPLSDVAWFDQNQIISPGQTVPTVLIESSHYDTRILFITLLKIWSFEVVESANFEDSLTLIDNERPSVILLDCLESFEETLNKIRFLRENKSSFQIPVIVFSEFAGEDYKNRMLNAGADEYLLKPLNFAELESVVQENIEKYQRSILTAGGLL